jgi:hypothetical protein
MALILGAIVSVAGVNAVWTYAEQSVDELTQEHNLPVHEFVYTPEEMPKEEVSVVQRLSDILNRLYKSDIVEDSRDYLINETIQVFWNNNPAEDPFVGSMDKTFAAQIAALFEDVLFETGVSFILKNQDLNGDGYREIAMYSTADKLDNYGANYEGIVCVYVTVFTPTLDRSGNIIGYKQLCESLRGYCNEIYYSPNYRVPSFSTDTWLDSVGYTRWFRDYELPENAKLDYNSYNLEYNGYDTKLMGNSLATVLREKF